MLNSQKYISSIIFVICNFILRLLLKKNWQELHMCLKEKKHDAGIPFIFSELKLVFQMRNFSHYHDWLVSQNKKSFIHRIKRKLCYMNRNVYSRTAFMRKNN